MQDLGQYSDHPGLCIIFIIINNYIIIRAPDEGVMRLMVDNHTDKIIIRVLDYDWMKKDDILGEVLLDTSQCLNRGFLQFNLTRDGKAEKGEIVLSIEKEEQTDQSFMEIDRHQICLKINIQQAIHLRSADWVFIRE